MTRTPAETLEFRRIVGNGRHSASIKSSPANEFRGICGMDVADIGFRRLIRFSSKKTILTHPDSVVHLPMIFEQAGSLGLGCHAFCFGRLSAGLRNHNSAITASTGQSLLGVCSVDTRPRLGKPVIPNRLGLLPGNITGASVSAQSLSMDCDPVARFLIHYGSPQCQTGRPISASIACA